MDARQLRGDRRKARPGAWAAVAAVLLSVLPVAAVAAERVALVIGNSAYEHVPFLPNPGNDAKAVGDAFKSLDYEVTWLMDADYHALHDGVRRFKQAARGKEVAVVFYAGHGIGVGGENYLVPVDAELGYADTVEDETISLKRLMSAVGNTRHLGLVILDACRNNPFVTSMKGSTRSVDRGLARLEETHGKTMVAYAARHGEVASDGDGAHSPYTEALLKYLKEEPGLPVRKLFGKVHDAVVDTTTKRLGEERKQEPWTYEALGGRDFYLASADDPDDPDDKGTAGGGAPPPSGAAAVQGPEPVGSVQSPERRAAEVVLPDGLTLADWAWLAEDRLKTGDHARLLEEAGAYLREYGQFESVEAIREQAVSGLVAELQVTMREDAPGALERIARLEAAAGERPELLHLKARAHGLLGDHAAEEAAYLQWLRSVPQTHPERRNVLSALARARAAHEQIRQFSELLGRPFSQEWKEDSAGWTDLHYAALLDLPGVVAALVDAGMDVDTRLKDDSPPFGDGLKRTLAALGHGDEDWEDWKADGETPLMIAAVVNTRKAADALIAQGADVNAVNPNYGSKPLHYAAGRNALDVAKLLIDRGADVNAKQKKGKEPLHIAAWKNSLDVANLLIERGADVNAKGDDEETPLFPAARANALDVAKLLIDHGADVNAKRYEDTPLFYAAMENALDVAKLLIDRGADMNAKRSSGTTALSFAVGKSLEVTKLLIDHGADGATPLHRAAVYNRLGVAKQLIERGADVNVKTSYANLTPLHLAALSNSLDVAKQLIERGADVNANEENGETPLFYAAMANALDVAKLLIDRGSDVNAKTDSGSTPLRSAAWGNSLETAKLLIERGADVNPKTSSNWTPLHNASRYNYSPDVAKLLLDHGADVNAKNSDGETPLHQPAWFKNHDVAKLLLDHGADVNAKDSDGETPLHVAARSFRNPLDVAKLLLDRGADVNAKDNDGETPLLSAARYNSHYVAKLLLDHGADVNVKNDDGETPLDVAIEKGYGGMQAMLRRHGGRCATRC